MTDRKPTPEDLIARWEAAAAAWAHDCNNIGDAMCVAGFVLATALERSLAREQRLREALRPFASGCLREPCAPTWDLRQPPDPDCCAYCAARAALEDSDGE